MDEIASKDRLSCLEQKQNELISELDALNARLEQTLSSLSPSGDSPAEDSM